MTRITNELFESIRQITHPIIAEDNLSGNEIKEKKLHPNQQVLDVHEPEKDKLTAKDFEMLRAGKKQKAVKEDVKEGQAPMYNVRDMKTNKVVGTHSADTGFRPNSADSGLKPHPTSIPNYHKIDRSVNLRQQDQLKSRQGVKEGRVDAAHFCATHVEHDLYGEGECISEAHADPDEHGNIAWYTVQFADGVRKVQTEAVKVKKGKMHEHAEAEAESIEEGTMGHAGTVTMKQVNKSNASPAVKAAIKKAAPDIKSYGDRAAALDAAGIKRESVEQIDEIGDTPAGMEKVKAYRAAVGRQYHKTGEYDTRLSDTDRKPNPFHAKDAANMPNAANKRYSRQTGAARAKKIEMGTRYEEANFALEEGISETIVKHNDFTIEITDNPTYGDFLRAVQSIVRTDEESMQQEIVAIAEEAYAENYEDVIIESFTRMEIEDKLAAHRKAGNTVSNDKFSTKNGEPYAEYVVTDTEGGRKKYIHHGSVRRMESMPGKTAKSSKEE